MHVKIAIAEYILIDSVLVEAVVITAVPSVPVISEKIRRAAAERVPLRPRVLL